ADGRYVEALFARLLGWHAVVGDRRAEHGEAAFVDQLAVRVDDRLHRPLRQPFNLAEHDLDRAVDDALLEALIEDELEALRQISAHLLRVALGQHEVEQVSELDGLGRACVGHAKSPNLIVVPHGKGGGEAGQSGPAKYVLIISTSPATTTGSSLSGPAMAARAAAASGTPSACNRAAAMST